jgi:2-phosphosulfolactate phosphatase
MLMKITRAILATCHLARDCAVAIDVLRAFTTAAYLFDAGVEEIMLVSGVEEAFNLRDALPDCLISGEMDGIKVPGFDLGNSPSEILSHDLRGRRLIQRTSAGTQGVVLAKQARTILAASLVNVAATVHYLQAHNPEEVTLIQTGLWLEEGWGDEDAACADLVENRLAGRETDLQSIVSRVKLSRSGRHFDGTRPDFPPADLDYALQFDRFNFVMRVVRSEGLSILRSIPVDPVK